MNAFFQAAIDSAKMEIPSARAETKEPGWQVMV
jgi:hypothetical protein